MKFLSTCLPIITLLLIAQNSSAQYYEYGDSVMMKGEKIQYHFNEQNELLVKRAWDDHLYFDLFNENLQLIKQWKFDLKASMNRSERIMTYRYHNGSLELFIQKEHGGRKREWYIFTLDDQNSKKLIYTARGSKGFEPNLHLQRLGKSYILWYESLSHPFKKNKRINIHRFNEYFELQWSDSFVLDLKDRLQVIMRLRVNKKSDYELITRNYKVNRMKHRYGKPNSEICHYSIINGELKKNIFLPKDRFYTGIKIEYMGDWSITGMYSKKYNRNDGIFHAHFNAGNPKINLCDPFPKKMGRSLSPLQITNKIQDLVVDHYFEKDSFRYWLAEEFYYKLRGTPTVPAYEFHHGSVLLIKTDWNYKLVDWKTVPKRQVSNSRTRYFSSYQMEQDSSQLMIYSNPSKKVWLKNKNYQAIEAKKELGFYVMQYQFKSVPLYFREAYYPVDNNKLPLIGSIQNRRNKSFMILIPKNRQYYQPVYYNYEF